MASIFVSPERERVERAVAEVGEGITAFGQNIKHLGPARQRQVLGRLREHMGSLAPHLESVLEDNGHLRAEVANMQGRLQQLEIGVESFQARLDRQERSFQAEKAHIQQQIDDIRRQVEAEQEAESILNRLQITIGSLMLDRRHPRGM